MTAEDVFSAICDPWPDTGGYGRRSVRNYFRRWHRYKENVYISIIHFKNPKDPLFARWARCKIHVNGRCFAMMGPERVDWIGKCFFELSWIGVSPTNADLVELKLLLGEDFCADDS